MHKQAKLNHFCNISDIYNKHGRVSSRYLRNTLQSFTIPVTIIHINSLLIIMTPEAERFNGWAAMLGFVAAVGAYVTTGQIIPGWF